MLHLCHAWCTELTATLTAEEEACTKRVAAINTDRQQKAEYSQHVLQSHMCGAPVHHPAPASSQPRSPAGLPPSRPRPPAPQLPAPDAAHEGIAHAVISVPAPGWLLVYGAC